MRAERRQFIRIKRGLVTSFTDLATGKRRRALTKNIGTGGVCLVTEHILEPGTKLEVQIIVPDSSEIVVFSAEVVWSRPLAAGCKSYGNPTAETGIKVVRIDPEHRMRLLRYTTTTSSESI